ncbi:efflux RND transporter permease subunit [Patescibacteria group bacterium]
MKKINKSPKSYLERIKFDPKLEKGPIAGWVTNIRLVILLVLVISLLGLFAYFNIPRRLNPEIKIPIISIVTVLPGATPEDIESLISIPLENDLLSTSGIDTLTSVSQDNVSFINIQFKSQISQDKAKQDVQSIVDAFSELPGDAQTPKVMALDFENRPFWTFAVKGSDLPSLMRFSKILKDNIESISKVDRVNLAGFEDQQISVKVKPEKLIQYNINPLAISSMVKSGLSAYPAGIVQTQYNNFSLAIDPDITSIKDIRNIKINLRGTTIPLGEIADISETSVNSINNSYYIDSDSNPERVVTFSVYKVSSANFNEVEELAQKEVSRTISDFDEKYQIITITNYAEEINMQFDDLVGEFRSTILLVVGCLFLFLGLRQALISSVTVPLTFLSAFIFMQMFGMSINFLSLFAFLIALGLLIDDTIVTVQSMTTYYKTGKFTPTQAGLVVWRDLIVPIWSTTATTIWSFAPLLLSTGIIGEFIKPIPVVVTVTMISSTGIAVLITLPFMIVLLKPKIPKRVSKLFKISVIVISLATSIYLVRDNPLLGIIAVAYIILIYIFVKTRGKLGNQVKKTTSKNPTFQIITKKLTHYSNHGVLDMEIIAKKYERLISKILASKKARKKVIIGILIYSVWAFSLLPLGFVKNEFFPKTDSELIYLTLENPSGTKSEITDSMSLEILESLKSTPESNFVIAEIGMSQSSMGGTSSNPNSTLFTVHLPEKNSRIMSSIQISELLRNKFADYSKAKLSVTELSEGPPAGADLQITLLGADLGILDGFANNISEFLNKSPGVTNVEKSIKPGTSKIVFVPDTDKLSQSGLTVESVALWLRTFASGFSLGELNTDGSGDDKKDILFTLGDGFENPENISSLSIPSPTGQLPLLSLGNLISKSNPTQITREGGKRTLSVSAGIKPGFALSDKNRELTQFVDNLKMPDGYSWKTGGVNEENAKSVQSIIQAMGLAFILILVTMVIQFKSYRQAIIVLMVIPFAVSSVFVAFALTNTPLSFPALIGILALFGIVVTNSMFIVDKININQKEKMPFEEAIADAGASRLEPIVLTKLCTILGLLPISLSSPLWRGLGGAIISGILIASTIMLLFIPVVYYEWFKGENKQKLRGLVS